MVSLITIVLSQQHVQMGKLYVTAKQEEVSERGNVHKCTSLYNGPCIEYEHGFQN